MRHGAWWGSLLMGCVVAACGGEDAAPAQPAAAAGTQSVVQVAGRDASPAAGGAAGMPRTAAGRAGASSTSTQAGRGPVGFAADGGKVAQPVSGVGAASAAVGGGMAAPAACDPSDKLAEPKVFPKERYANGGELARVGIGWLKWPLYGDQTAAGKGMFSGADCEPCKNSMWTVKKKNMD